MLALIAHAKWIAAFLAVIGFGLLSYRGLLPVNSYELRVPMDSAQGLYPGSDVLIAGSRAGLVQRIELRGTGVVVSISVDPSHAPVHSDARIMLRPKSLLGERYLDLNPGTGGDLIASGGTLPASRVSLATDLADVINTFDEPTREKLRTVLVELGGGVAGRGVDTNQTIHAGTTDLTDLATVANTLKQRDAELERIIQSLDTVTAELARSDRRQQLGELIRNSDRLLKNLAEQDAELKRALAQTNAALGRTDAALGGAEGNLKGILAQTPTLVQRTNSLMGDLSAGSDVALQTLPTQLQSIRETAIVFGGKDANGYATRISVLVGGSTGGVAPPNATVPASMSPSDADLFRFLIGGPAT
ncbi:MAG: hypothetical protein NVS9B1_03740 [Candidatus Dormibacteraceae bacterium]